MMWKFTIIVLFLVALIKAHATTKKVKIPSLHIYPQDGKVVALGRVRPGLWEINFYGEKGWTAFPHKAEVTEGIGYFDAVKQIFKNDLFLFYADTEVNNHGELKDFIQTGVISIHNERFNEAINSLAKMHFGKTLNIAWQFCREDSECLKVQDNCGIQVGINKKFKSNFLSFLNSLKAVCPKEILMWNKNSKCVEYFCS